MDRLSLLGLPAEIVRIVMHHLDTESFFLCLQTCKQLRAHALASKSLMHDHLDRVPGQPVPRTSNVWDAKTLLGEFSKRASHHLKNGASYMSDVNVWRTPAGTNSSKNFIVNMFVAEDDESSCLAYVEVQTRDDTVKVYILDPAETPKLEYTISTHTLQQHLRCPNAAKYEEENAYQVKVKALKVVPWAPAWSESPGHYHVAILYQIMDQSCACDDEHMKVIFFRLKPGHGPVVVETSTVSSKDVSLVDMAVTRECEPVILWRSRIRHNHPLSVVIYRRENDRYSLESREFEDIIQISAGVIHPLERVFGVYRQGSELHINGRALPISQWIVDYAEHTQVERDLNLPYTFRLFEKPSMGRAIHSHHHHQIEDERLDEDGDPTCVNTVLQLVLSNTQHPHSPPVTPHYGLPVSQPSRIGAYLVKAVQPLDPGVCVGYDHDRTYHRLHHKYVAELVNFFDMGNLSTLGLKMAISRMSKRIAFAHWKTVKVWSLDPEAFLDREFALGDPNSNLVPDVGPSELDRIMDNHPAVRFYKCHDLDIEEDVEQVYLHPVELPECGVVYNLEFRGEDELWAMCDTGIVKWSFGVHSKARRQEADLVSVDGESEEGEPEERESEEEESEDGESEDGEHTDGEEA